MLPVHFNKSIRIVTWLGYEVAPLSPLMYSGEDTDSFVNTIELLNCPRTYAWIFAQRNNMLLMKLLFV